MNSRPLVLVVFLLFISLAIGQGNNTNSTGGIYCPNNCNSRAPACDSEVRNTCWCLYGFYDDDCSSTVATDVPGAWYTIRVVFVLAFGFCGFLGSMAIIYGPVKPGAESNSPDSLSFFFNVRKGVLVTLVLLSLDTVLYYAIDPQGFEFILPFVVVQLIFGVVFVLLSVLYTLVLFHWAEIYYTTIKVLKREEMLEKINSKYQSNITLDTVLGNIKFLNKLKIPFVILNVLALIVQLIRDLWFGITIDPMNEFSNVWTAAMLLLYLIEAVGFLFYGRKLLSVLPDELKKKMRRVTFTILIITFLFLGSFIYSALAFIFLVRDSWTFIAADGIWRLVLLAIVIFVLSLFVKPTRRWPFVTFGVTTSRRESSHERTSTELSAVHIENKLAQIQEDSTSSSSEDSSETSD